MMKRVLISILARVKGNVNANGTIAALTEIKKFFTTEGETRVYVSGRCVKYCIKDRLQEKGFHISPLARSEERGARVLLPEGNPVENIDDDLFGYLIPAEERKRFAPIKTDGIVALKHCEITRDFGGRFDPTGKEDTSPFEIEVADFIGQNNWILNENIGKFLYQKIRRDNREIENEITQKIIEKARSTGIVLNEEDLGDGIKTYSLLPDERKNRIKAFLEVLLKERYTFPRSATSLHQPEYYYAVILSTSRLLPLFANIEYKTKDGKVLLDISKIENLAGLLNENEKITIIDFKRALNEVGKLEGQESVKIILPNEIDTAINETSEFLVGA
jgi:CRISPR-associated protein Cst2